MWAVKVLQCMMSVSWGPADLGVIIVVCVSFYRFWWIPVAGSVGGDFCGFGVREWIITGSAYVVGVV